MRRNSKHPLSFSEHLQAEIDRARMQQILFRACVLLMACGLGYLIYDLVVELLVHGTEHF
jgi:hypothetical protein